jgi:prophage antirepressor-like protein/DNA-binding CsgD family transcriptional regulator
MSTELTPFEFRAHQLRVQTDEQGNPWFCAKDACDILGYVNSRDAVKKHCKEGGVANRYIPELSNTYTLISEGNLYRLIIKSNKPEAEPFEAWVCDEVLPTIRKTGVYDARPATCLTLDQLAALLNQPVVITGWEALSLLRKQKAEAEGREINGPKLTPEERARVLAMREAGKSYRVIAETLGRKEGTIKSIIHRYGKDGAA